MLGSLQKDPSKLMIERSLSVFLELQPLVGDSLKHLGGWLCCAVLGTPTGGSTTLAVRS